MFQEKNVFDGVYLIFSNLEAVCFVCFQWLCLTASIAQTKQHKIKPTNRKKDNGFIYSISLQKISLLWKNGTSRMPCNQLTIKKCNAWTNCSKYWLNLSVSLSQSNYLQKQLLALLLTSLYVTESRKTSILFEVKIKAISEAFPK